MEDVRLKGVLLATCVMVICCDVAFSLGCTGKQADIVFVVDASGSIGSDNWPKQLKFVVDVINLFEVGLSEVRIGMVTFDSDVCNQFHLNHFNNKADMVRKVNEANYTEGGTDIGKAVQYILDNSFKTDNGSRLGVPHLAVFVTDAIYSLTEDEIKKLHGKNIHVFAIGIGYNTGYENYTAQYMGLDLENVFLVEDFIALIEIKDKVAEGACTVRDCGEAPIVEKGWRDQIIRVSDNLTGRQEASYHCRTGYDLIGEWNISCQDNGAWQSPPTCKVKDCGNPPNVSDSKVKYDATTFRSNASYTCDETHYMLGCSNTTCEKDGNWSQPPKCHKSFCQPDVCLNDGQCIEMPVPVPRCENIHVPLKFNTSVTIETAKGRVSRPCSALYERSSVGRVFHVCRDLHRHCIDFPNVTLQNHLCNCSHAYHGASCEKGPYYLGGAMSWKRVHNSSNEILVSYRSQWKRGFGPCGFSCNVSDVGKGANKSVGEIVVLFNDTVVQTVDHKYHIEEVTTGQSSNDLDYEMGLGSFVIKLPNDTTDIANFSLRFQGSGWARLSWKSPDEYRLNAFGNGTFVLHNHSPAVANFKTLHYRYNWGCEHSLYLPLPDDVDGDVVRCRWATTEESGTASMGLPGAILDEENCTITFNATSDNHYQRQGLYAVNLIFEDFSDELSFSPKSSVPLQILVTTSTSSNDCNGNAIEVMEPQTSSHVLLKGSIFRMKFSIKLPADGTRPRLKIVLGPGKMRVVKEEIVDDRLETEVEWKPKPAQSGRTKFCVAAEHRGPGSLLSRLLCQVILVNVLNPCEKNPPYCKNDGDCIPLPNDTSPIPSCDCPENFLGDLCEIDAKAEFEAFHRSRALWGAKTGFEPGASDLKWWHVLIISVGGIGLVLNLLFINFVLRKRETIERDQGPLQKYKRTNQRGGRRPIISRRKVAPMPPAYNDIYNFEKKPGSFTVEPKVKPLVIPTYDELLEKNYVDN